MSSVNKGVSEFSTPARLLVTCCCAMANKKLGIADPKNATLSKGLQRFQSIFDQKAAAMGRYKAVDKVIRHIAICMGWKICTECLIKKKDPPQTAASKNIRNQSKGTGGRVVVSYMFAEQAGYG